MKKSVEPAWLPHRYSWLKALMLALLMTAITDLIRISRILGYVQARFADNPEPFVVGGILALLLPIPAIAFAHHLIPLFLSRFFPKIQVPERGGDREFVPSLISWWEGLYGWLVLVLSTLITACTCTLLLPLFNLSYEKIRLGVNRWAEIELLAWLAVIWIGNAAEFYQIEYVVKRRLIAINAVRSKATNSALNLVLKPETEANPLEDDGGEIPTIGEIAYSPEKKLLERENRRHARSLAKKLLIPLFIILIASGIYGFAKWSELQEATLFPVAFKTSAPSSSKSAELTPTFATSKIPARLSSIAPASQKNPVTSENPLPVPYAPPTVKQAQANIQEPPPSAQFDPFQQAVYKATSAANLTQLAQSQVEWVAIARQWEEAIALMKAVPQSSPHYQLAQSKAIEYQQNLTYALKASASRP